MKCLNKCIKNLGCYHGKKIDVLHSPIMLRNCEPYKPKESSIYTGHFKEGYIYFNPYIDLAYYFIKKFLL